MITLLIRNASESKVLLQLALKAAKGLERELSLILFTRQDTNELRDLRPKDPTWMQELNTDKITNIKVCGGSKCYALTEKYLEQSSPKLLILGKHLSAHAETDDTKFSRHLYESLSCQTLLVRLGSTEEAPLERHLILVAAGEGPHTTRALKLAYAIAGNNTVALHLSADVDSVSMDLAEVRLRKIIKKAGISPETIQSKVVLGTNVTHALRNEVENGIDGQPYSMLLLGSSETSGLREKLFGTIPSKLINKTGGLTIGVVRTARPVQDRLLNAFGKRIALSIPQLSREEKIVLFDEIEHKSMWSFDFATLMTLSAMVAGLGLLANSGAVVIGAMLIAPLMMPLIGCGLALAQGHTPLFKNAFRAVIKGFLFALFTGLLLGLIARYFHIPLTNELAARGNPSLLDLGIAFVSGIAASYCIARPNLTGALAGVAIAAALVPPIATTGICLTMGELDVAKGAGLLFGTNVVAVIFGAALNFILAGIRGQGKAGDNGRRFIFTLALTCLGLAIPLSSVLLNNIPKLEEAITHLPAKQTIENTITKSLPEEAKLENYNHTLHGEVVHYHLVISVPYQLTSDQFIEIKTALTNAHTDIPVKVEIENRIVLGDRK